MDPRQVPVHSGLVKQGLLPEVASLTAACTQNESKVVSKKHGDM